MVWDSQTNCAARMKHALNLGFLFEPIVPDYVLTIVSFAVE